MGMQHAFVYLKEEDSQLALLSGGRPFEGRVWLPQRLRRIIKKWLGFYFYTHFSVPFLQ